MEDGLAIILLYTDNTVHMIAEGQKQILESQLDIYKKLTENEGNIKLIEIDLNSLSSIRENAKLINDRYSYLFWIGG